MQFLWKSACSKIRKFTHITGIIRVLSQFWVLYVQVGQVLPPTNQV